MPFSLTELEKAYLAGIVDGEGSVTVFHQANTGGFQLRVSICSTSRSFIEWLSEKLGKNIFTDTHKYRKGSKVKDLYQVNTHGNEAQDLLRQLLPYMIIKKNHALISLEFPCCTFRGHRYTREERLQQAICSVRLTEINKKGGGG